MTLNKILFRIFIALFCLIIFLGLSATFSVNQKKKIAFTAYQNRAQNSLQINAQNLIKPGQLRTFSKADDAKNSALIIVTPSLEYDSSNKPFFEEIDTKLSEIKNIISSYFTNYTEQELIFKGEQVVKFEILQKINDVLVLGKIRNIYFDEYMFL